MDKKKVDILVFRKSDFSSSGLDLGIWEQLREFGSVRHSGGPEEVWIEAKPFSRLPATYVPQG